jgi:hypothetical protein
MTPVRQGGTCFASQTPEALPNDVFMNFACFPGKAGLSLKF